jgi:hypothetical protein
MHRRSPAVGLTAAVLAGLILAAVSARPLPAVAVGRPAVAAACKSRVPGQPPSPGQEAGLEGAAVLSDAGVPGTYHDVAADRAGDAWAVGSYLDGSRDQALAVRLG